MHVPGVPTSELVSRTSATRWREVSSGDAVGGGGDLLERASTRADDHPPASDQHRCQHDGRDSSKVVTSWRWRAIDLAHWRAEQQVVAAAGIGNGQQPVAQRATLAARSTMRPMGSSGLPGMPGTRQRIRSSGEAGWHAGGDVATLVDHSSSANRRPVTSSPPVRRPGDEVRLRHVAQFVVQLLDRLARVRPTTSRARDDQGQKAACRRQRAAAPAKRASASAAPQPPRRAAHSRSRGRFAVSVSLAASILRRR